MAYRLLIADDHQVIIDGFLAIFENVPEVEVVATARNGIEALEQLSKVEVDVILLDIDMPVLNGVETCKKISRDFPDIKVISLSMYDQTSYLRRMLQFGAKGYLLKDDSAQEVEEAIYQVMKGDRYISSQMQKNLRSIDHLIGVETRRSIEISPREKEVLLLLSDGFTDPQIGEKLFISHHTVKTHRKSLLMKFEARNTVELIKKAVEKGLI